MWEMKLFEWIDMWFFKGKKVINIIIVFDVFNCLEWCVNLVRVLYSSS